jgi:hypothetical protein
VDHKITDKDIIELSRVNINSKNKFKLSLEKIEYDTGVIELRINFNGKHFQRGGDDYFSCFQRIKDDLLKCNTGIQCYGSKVNVYPSPMMRTSNNLAYILETGKPAIKENIVNIFEYTDINEFATSEEQNILDLFNNQLESY